MILHFGECSCHILCTHKQNKYYNGRLNALKLDR